MMKMKVEEVLKDLDIALYKLWEALQVGHFEPNDYENLNRKYQELKAKYLTRNGEGL